MTCEKEAAVSDVSERIEQLEGTVERVQAVLDHVQRGLSTAEKTHKTARGVVTILRRAVMVVVIGGLVFAGLSVLRQRLR
jgi:DNA integrity scanning protein DisA with diadenylate cyclase activity